jgi:hypothetical protein
MDMRARYYQPEDGRFLTEDSWQGDQNQPMSYNAWLYGYSNPEKYTDPDGNFPSHCPFMNELDCLSFYGLIPDYKGLMIVELNKSSFDQAAGEIEKNGLHESTIAAAIAVQSQWSNFLPDLLKEYAYMFHERGYKDNIIIDGILKNAGVGWAKSCDLDKHGNLYIMSNSIKAMTERIKRVENKCDSLPIPCTQKDRLIIAGMAQNTWSTSDMDDLHGNTPLTKDHKIDWPSYFGKQLLLSRHFFENPITPMYDNRTFYISNYNTTFQLRLFTEDMMALHAMGWDLPTGISTVDLFSMLSLAILLK